MKAAMTGRLTLALAASALVALPSTAAASVKPPLHPGGAVVAKTTKKTTSKKKTDAKAPVIKKISPRSAKVGDTLVITGKNFVRGKGKNVVFFYTTKGGGTFTKAGDASSTRLKVVVPDKLATLLPANGDEARILLRVKGKHLGDRTATKISPLIAINPDQVGGDNSGPGAGGNTNPAGCSPNFNDPLSDVDHDLLSDAREKQVGLDACNRDTDGDGASDGYEYYSAVDLNSQALPYPWKTPYPNPLVKDASVDYDGDGLTLWDEYSLWTKFGQSQIPLNYSDGKQATQPQAAPDPAGPLYYLDINGNGALSDDERDADGDGLSNWDESHGRMTAEWWKATYDGNNDVLETPYPVAFGPVNMLDPDSDGDTLPDGADDTDFDGLPNTFEVARPGNWASTYVSTGPGLLGHNFNYTTGLADFNPATSPVAEPGYRYYARVNPFNPCKPVWGPNCHLHPPFGYYGEAEDWMGWGVPGSGQVIPAPGTRPGDV
jgi:hypothetical protein